MFRVHTKVQYFTRGREWVIILKLGYSNTRGIGNLIIPNKSFLIFWFTSQKQVILAIWAQVVEFCSDKIHYILYKSEGISNTIHPSSWEVTGKYRQ